MSSRHNRKVPAPARLISLGLAAMATAAVAVAARAEEFSPLQNVPLTDLNSNLPGALPRISTSGVRGDEGLDRHSGEYFQLSLDKPEVAADGRSTATLTIEVFDARGQPLQRDVRVNVTATRGKLLTASVDSTQMMKGRSVDQERRVAGVQVLTHDGRAQVVIEAPIESGDATVVVSSGNLEMETRLPFVAELRPLLAVGLVDLAVRYKHTDAGAQAPVIANDGLEDELQQIGVSHDGNSSLTSEGRGAVFAKGTVNKDYLVTLSYDSNRDRTRFFRDIQPDQFYPIYGDSSIRGFDAQTTRAGYLRVEKGLNYFQFGDFNTENNASRARSLGAYQRTLTGVQQHFENALGQINLFASQDTLRRVIDEQPGRGLSGPYQVSNGNGVLNSEVIEIITRDRNQPAVILDVQRLARFTDYQFEPFSGQILFNRPIPTVDSNLNPVSIRVTYEVDSGGPKFWVAGGNAQLKLGKALELGGSFADNSDPLTPYSLYSGNLTWKIDRHTSWLVEAASSFDDPTAAQTRRRGNGFRTEFLHTGSRVDARLYFGGTDAGFDNPSATLTAGRREASGKVTVAINATTDVALEAIQTQDAVIGADRTAGSLQLGKTFMNRKYRWDLGVRYGKDQVNTAAGAQAQPLFTSVYTLQPDGTLSGGAFSNGAFANGQISPDSFTTLHTRVTAAFTKRFSGYVEGDTDFGGGSQTGDRRAWGYAVGADYLVHDKTRVYLRQEQAQSLGSLYGLGTGAQHSATLLGISTNYREDAQLFSEYRISDAIDGRQSEAAVGLRNLWRVSPGFAFTTNFERLETLSGTPQRSIAAGVGYEYTAADRYKSSGRLERRVDPASVTYLSTWAFTARLTPDWSFLARNLYNHYEGDLSGQGTTTQDRAIVGLAYRDTATNVMSSLMRYELKNERDTNPAAPIDRRANIVSYHTNYKPGANLTLSGQLAAEWVDERVADTLGSVNAHYTAQLLAGRVLYDLTDRWDLGLNASVLRSDPHTAQYGVGLEVGRILVRNLWLSAGYNISGFNDRDLSDSDYFNKGVYLRLRYKFDEKIFGAALAPAAPVVVVAPIAVAPAPAPAPALPPPPPVLDSDGDGVPDSLDKCPNTPPGDRVDESGCGLIITIAVQFDTNSSQIKPESFVELDAFVDFLKASPTARGVIEGHTDSVGSAAYNQKLSEKRAESVLRYVEGKGVESARLTTKGFGATQPIADNSTPEGRAQNRRVLFKRASVQP